MSLGFLTQKPLTLKRRDRRRGGFPIGSSLPRHNAKDRTRQTQKRQRGKTEENQGQTASLHRNREITILYDA